MARTALALLLADPEPFTEVREEPVARALSQVRARLPSTTDHAVMVDLLEDDLEQGLASLCEVEAHFTDVLDALAASKAAPVSLIEAADGERALAALDVLTDSVQRVQRRVAQLAARLRVR